MDKKKIAGELVKLAKGLLANEVYRFKSIGGGLDRIFVSRCGFGEKGIDVDITLFSSIGATWNKEVEDDNKINSVISEDKKKLSADVGKILEKCDKEIIDLLKRNGYTQKEN